MEKDQDRPSSIPPPTVLPQPRHRLHRSRLRLDSFAAGGGLLAIPAAFLVAKVGLFGLNFGMILLSSLAALASLASFLGALYGGSKLPLELAPACGARSGVRAGLLTLILGGGTVVLLATLLSREMFGYSLLPIPATLGFLPILGLIVLPVLLAAMVAGWLGGWVESNSRVATIPDETSSSDLIESEDPRCEPVWWKTALPYILIASGLCYASPVLSMMIPEKADLPLVENPPPQPPPEPEQPVLPEFVGPPQPPPPPYRYEMPVGFADAPASRITIIEQEDYSGVLTNAPIQFSPDSKLLAFCRQHLRQFSVVVIRLDDRQQVASITLQELPIGLAWSQDSKRLLYLARETPRYAGILFLDNGSNIELPIPNGERLPAQADLVWPFEKEVVIVAPNYEPAYLDLDTLRIHPLSNSRNWRSLTEEKKTAYHEMARGEYYSNNRWLVAPLERPTYYKPPNHFLANWIQQNREHMAVMDQEFVYAHLIAMSIPQRVDRLIATPDRSVFVHLHDNNAEISYFGLREEPELRTSFARSEIFPGDNPPEEAMEHLKNRTLTALICPPIVNPLNDNVVGPDRTRVRAMARMAMLETDQVEFWIAEEYEPVREGDVVGDLHYWSKDEPHSLEDPELEDWWITMPPVAPLERGLVVMRKEVPPRSAAKIADSLPRKQFEPGARDPDAIAPPEERIRDFIEHHHLKVTQRQLDDYAADYARETDYFDNGKVSPEFIREDQKKYQSKYSKKIEETVQGRIVVKPVGQNLYEARYKMHSSVAGQKEWEWMEADVEVTLGIRLINKLPFIVSERSKVLDVQHGKP